MKLTKIKNKTQFDFQLWNQNTSNVWYQVSSQVYSIFSSQFVSEEVWSKVKVPLCILFPLLRLAHQITDQINETNLNNQYKESL
jgi:hypothetical protein